jgi:hypothetical protein
MTLPLPEQSGTHIIRLADGGMAVVMVEIFGPQSARKFLDEADKLINPPTTKGVTP